MTDGGAGARARGRRRILLISSLVVLVAVYVLSNVLYAVGGQVTEAGGDKPLPGSVRLSIMPQSVDAVRDRFAIQFDVLDPGPAGDQFGLTQTLGVVVSGADGDRMIEFGTNGLPSPVSIDLITDGVVELWPFDVHSGVTTVVAYRVVDGEPEALDTWVSASGRVPGWSISAEEVDVGLRVEIDGVTRDMPAVKFTATRSGSTIAFGMMLLALMVVMPVLVLSVAISVYRGRRRLEPSFMSWMAAMLFATIPLRTFLPGSPPIGSWIDFLMVLWVIVGLIAALVIYVAAWFRWSSRLDGGSPGASGTQSA